jgi:hypothetical protein
MPKTEVEVDKVFLGLGPIKLRVLRSRVGQGLPHNSELCPRDM